MRDNRLDNQLDYNNEEGTSKLVKTIQFDENGTPLQIDAVFTEVIDQLQQLAVLLKPLSVTSNGGNKLFVDINTIIGGVVNRLDSLTTLQNQQNTGGVSSFLQMKSLSNLEMDSLFNQMNP